MSYYMYLFFDNQGPCLFFGNKLLFLISLSCQDENIHHMTCGFMVSELDRHCDLSLCAIPIKLSDWAFKSISCRGI